MSELDQLKNVISVADQLLEIATKEDVAECARLLAINIAHYQSAYGELDLDETLEMAYSEDPNDAQLKLVTKGMETLIGLLGGIVQGFDEKTSH